MSRQQKIIWLQMNIKQTLMLWIVYLGLLTEKDFYLKINAKF